MTTGQQIDRALTAIKADPDWDLNTIDGKQFFQRTATSTGDHRITWTLVHQDSAQPKLDVRVELETGDDIVLTLGLHEGKLSFTGIRVDGMLSGVNERLPINPETLKRLRLAGISEQVARELKRPWLKYLLSGLDDEWAKGLSLRPGRKGRNDYFFAELAQEYLEVCAWSSEPLLELHANRPFSLKTTKNQLTEARKRGLLTAPPVRGKAGGELTPKALALLKGDDQ
jgi:hypothetical protein